MCWIILKIVKNNKEKRVEVCDNYILIFKIDTTIETVKNKK
jgi:hypothetical protein